MGILGYPGWKTIAAHQAFAASLAARRASVLSNELATDTAEWLRLWLRDHIGVADRDYAGFSDSVSAIDSPDRRPPLSASHARDISDVSACGARRAAIAAGAMIVAQRGGARFVAQP